VATRTTKNQLTPALAYPKFRLQPVDRERLASP
jgi:hypothetical protein